MNRKGITKSAFEAQMENKPANREDARQFVGPRPTLPAAESTIEQVEAIWSKTTNWIEL